MKNLLYCLVLLSVTVFPVQAASDYKLLGKGLLEYSIFGFDLYDGSLYVKKDQQFTKEQLVSGDVDSYLLLHYKRDISSENSAKGWKKGVQAHFEDLSKYQEALNWLIAHTPDFKEGDKLKLEISNKTLRLFHNGEKTAQSKDPKVLDIVYISWIGPKAVDEDFRQALLKNL